MCYVQTPEKWVFREREKGEEKDGAWKDGQTLVSQVFAWKQTPASRTHPFFLSASEYGSTSREDAMTPVSYGRCDRWSEFRVKEKSL